MRNFCYRSVQFLVRVFFKTFFKTTILNKENLPKKGGFIIASNHFSNFDPPLIGSFFGRDDLFYMAKEELFENKIFGAILKFIKAFPVKRGAVDKKSLNFAFKILEEEHCLLMFPEGTRRKNNQVNPKKGIGFIYANSQKDVIPIKISKNVRNITLIVGKPLEIDRTKNYLEISGEILTKIEEL